MFKPGLEQMVSVFPGRSVMKPQKAPALTGRQTVKAVAGEKGRQGERRRMRREGGEGESQSQRE